MNPFIDQEVHRIVYGNSDFSVIPSYSANWDLAIQVGKVAKLSMPVQDLTTPERLCQIALKALRKSGIRPLVESQINHLAKAQPNGHHVIEFDGGTSCNIPSKGFGFGYGSFKIDDQEIQRVEFGKGHSCNSAEIRTLCAALAMLAVQVQPRETSVLIRGDSQIALRWVHHTGKPKRGSTPNFYEAIEMLRLEVARFGKVKTEWRTRNVSVAIFGH